MIVKEYMGKVSHVLFLIQMLTPQQVMNIMLTNQQVEALYMIDRFENFVGKISVIYKNIEKIKKNKMKEFGLSGNHVMSLIYLEQHPDGLTASKLCELISIDKAATSRALSDLVEKGFVYYPELDHQKKYRAIAMLTEKGKEVACQLDKIIYDIVREVGGQLTDEERNMMYYALDLIAEKIDSLANVFASKERDLNYD